MIPASFEFFPDEPQPKQPAAESVFFIVRWFLLGAGRFLVECLMAQCQAKLQVGFYFSCVQGAVEKPKFDRAAREGTV